MKTKIKIFLIWVFIVLMPFIGSISGIALRG